MDYFDEPSEFYHSSVEMPSSSEEMPRIEKRVVLSSCPDPCKVCGGESTGHHYGVSSCNGCKSFFRRTIMDNRMFNCVFQNDCLIPMQFHKREKRRKCRACRFRRCVEAGMNPLAIVTDNSQANIIAFSTRKNHFTEIPLKRLISSENRAEFTLDYLLYSEDRLQLLRKSIHNFRPDCGLTIDSLLDGFTAMGTSLPEMPPLSNWTMTLMNIEYHLNNRVPLPVIEYDMFPSNFKFWFYMDFVYQLSWISSFDFFKAIERTEQRHIVKIVALQLMILTNSYFSYRNNSSSCIFPDGSFFIWSTENMFDVIKNCFEIQLDEGEYALLKVLLLCNPTWFQLSSSTRCLLSSMQRKYTGILLNYCMRNYGTTEGPARMTTLIQLQNTVIHKASKARSRIELMTILKLRSMRETLVDQICDVENL